MSKIGASLNRMSQSVRWAFKWKDWNPTEKELAHAISCVQLEEKERLGRYVFRKDFRASLAGRLLLRKFVSEHSSIPYDKVLFARNRNNKPILKNDVKDISFNVSHQGDYTVLAGEMKNLKLGVDIMKLEYTGGKGLSEFFRIMDKNFSSSEWEEIRGISALESEQLVMFCRHWTLKESYVKALGVGITVDLQAIDFKTKSSLREDRITTDTVLYLDEVLQDWLFEETLLDSEHCVSVALQENNKTPKSLCKSFEVISIDDLLSHSVPLYSEDMSYVRKYFEKEEQPSNWK